MPKFSVLCFASGIWDDNAAVLIEAKDALEAAQNVCGGPLIEDRKLANLRAEVTAVEKPNRKTTYRIKN